MAAKAWHQARPETGEPNKTPEGMPVAESINFAYNTTPPTWQTPHRRTLQWYDGTPHPWNSRRVLALEPSLSDPEPGTDAASKMPHFFRTHRRRQKLDRSFPACAAILSGRKMGPGAGGMGLPHHRPQSQNPKQIFIAISSRTFRSDDEGKTWKTITKGLHSFTSPTPPPKSGPLRPPQSPCTRPSRMFVFMQKHWTLSAQ